MVLKGRGCVVLKAALQEGDLLFGARLDGVLVGLALVTVVDEQARLHSIMVDPDARGRGLGSELVRAALDACAAAGVRRAIAEIPASSVAALALLGNLGFARVGVLRVESSAGTRSEGKIVRR